MQKEITNIVIYKSIKDGKETVKSCIFYADGSVKEGEYIDGIDAVALVAKQKNITSKTAMKEMMNKEIFHVMSEKEFKERYDSFKPEISKEDINKLFEEKLNENIFVYEPEAEVVPYDKVVHEEEIEEPEDSHYESFENDDEEIEDEEEIVEEEIEEPEDSHYESFENDDEKIEDEEETTSNKDLGVKILALAVAGAVMTTAIAFCSHRCSKEGEIVESNLPTPTPTTATTTVDEDIDYGLEEVEFEANNDLYDDYSFAELLNVTTNETQRNAMINASAALNAFNGNFAENYLEAGNDIRPALTFDEVVALQQAYNNYSVEDVRAYFNGYEVNAIEMSNNYKNASLQLMGAYVIETSEHPVDMSILIDSQEGRDFYQRYHTMFLAAKEATGEEQLQLVNEFYTAVREDFPITEEVRTEGISHSEAHSSLEDYQLAVTPMIAAAEMIFQNLEIDYTLNTTENNLSEIDFINDIGLCNHADDKFERLETIMLGSYEDNTNPLYTQYRNAIINELMVLGQYPTSDSNRELANLRRFQEVVNHDNTLGRNSYSGYSYGSSYTGSNGSSSSSSSSSTSTETNSWEESTTTYRTETTYTYGNIPYADQLAIDQRIAQENAAAQAAAQAQANANAAALQAEANAQAATVNAEVAAFNQETQDQINNINTVINNGGTPNENNYSHIDFDNDHSDANGNLDGSVQNITTDPSGADQPLPDPNATAAQFEARNPVYDSATPASTSTVVVETTGGYTEWVDSGAYIEYGEDYIPYDADGNPIVISDGGYQYTR